MCISVRRKTVLQTSVETPTGHGRLKSRLSSRASLLKYDLYRYFPRQRVLVSHEYQPQRSRSLGQPFVLRLVRHRNVILQRTAAALARVAFKPFFVLCEPRNAPVTHGSGATRDQTGWSKKNVQFNNEGPSAKTRQVHFFFFFEK